MGNLKLNSIYINGELVPIMLINNSKVFSAIVRKIFDLSTSEIEADGETGGTYSFTITANSKWTITAPDWLTLSQNSGNGNATITVTVPAETGEKEGEIVVGCWSETKSIAISTEKDYSTKYLTFKITGSGNLKWYTTTSNTSYNKTIQYSKDNGSTWSSITSSNANSGATITVEAGDVVMFKGANDNYGAAYNRYTTFSGSTAQFSVEGNIMSLFYGDYFSGQTSLPSNGYQLTGLFNRCTGLTSAEHLVLPATTLHNYCYGYMFYACTSLTSAPELPATTLATYCYCEMFRNCSSLRKTPSVLPATALAYYCYYYMFNNCTQVNSIKCLATSGINSSHSTDNWLNGVSATGTFTKKAGATWPTGVNGIPSGWTVLEE